MVAFGIGTVVPVLIFAYGSRHTLAARGRELGTIANVGKPVMGGALLLIGAFAVSGTDKLLETWMVDHMPEWLLALTTRF